MNACRVKFFCIILLCSFAPIFSIGCKKSGEPFSGQLNAFKRYSYEQFHLTYEYSGDVRGTEELFASDYGKYEARQSKLDIFSPKEIHSSDNGSITRLTDIYTIDNLQKSVFHEHLSPLDSLYHLDADDIPSPQGYLESSMKRNYFKNTGVDSIAGKLATRWQQIDGNMTLWIWNGLLLRRHLSSSEGTLDMIIKNIDTLWKVDTTKFSIPSGYTNTTHRTNAPSTN